MLDQTGVGKITNKRRAGEHHQPSFAYAVYNRHALDLLKRVYPYLRSYKRERARLIISDYVRVTPRNGRYTSALLAERAAFEDAVMNTKPFPNSDRVREPRPATYAADSTPGQHNFASVPVCESAYNDGPG